MLVMWFLRLTPTLTLLLLSLVRSAPTRNGCMRGIVDWWAKKLSTAELPSLPPLDSGRPPVLVTSLREGYDLDYSSSSDAGDEEGFSSFRYNHDTASLSSFPIDSVNSLSSLSDDESSQGTFRTESGGSLSSLSDDESIIAQPVGCFLKFSKSLTKFRQNEEVRLFALREITNTTTYSDIYEEYANGWEGQHSLVVLQELHKTGQCDFLSGPGARGRRIRLEEAEIVVGMLYTGEALGTDLVPEYGIIRLMPVTRGTTYNDILKEYTSGWDGQQKLMGMRRMGGRNSLRKEVMERVSEGELIAISSLSLNDRVFIT